MRGELGMRIAVAAMMHESNSFTGGKTSLQDFNPIQGSLVFKSDYWLHDTPVGGIIAELRKQEAEIVPIYFAGALPSGIVTGAAYQEIKHKIVSGLKKEAHALNGICLALHGSMYVEDVADPEGDLLAAIRAVVPKDVRITAALDLHGTITDAMINNADAFVGYRTAPHIDMIETGEKSAGILVDALKKNHDLVMSRRYMPLLISGEQSETDAQPMNELIPLLDQAEEAPGIISASFFVGFVWADTPHTGANSLVVGLKSHCSDVQQQARRLADEFMNRRRDFDFTTEAWPLSEAIAIGKQAPAGPVIIADSGDNPTAGAAQDQAVVVQELLAQDVQRGLVVALVDPESIELCFNENEGNEIALNLGRLGTEKDAPALALTVQLEKLRVIDENRFAVVSAAGVTIVICEFRIGITEVKLLNQLDLDADSFQIIVIKSGYLSPQYQRLAARKMFALTAGDTNLQVERLEYKRAPRPIFPLDDL